jgi:hypothetical protein
MPSSGIDPSTTLTEIIDYVRVLQPLMVLLVSYGGGARKRRTMRLSISG